MDVVEDGEGAGTCYAVLKSDHRRHKNVYGEAIYKSMILYSRVAHLVKVRSSLLCAARLADVCLLSSKSAGVAALESFTNSNITAQRRYNKLCLLHERIQSRLLPDEQGSCPAFVDGARQELRLSLYGDTLTAAVDGVMHLFSHDWAAYYAFYQRGVVDMDVIDVPISTLSSSMRKRFEEADLVHAEVFLGRQNGAEPRANALAVLADLTNAVGLHYGSK